MTTKAEAKQALFDVRWFLTQLTIPIHTPKVHSEIRQRAAQALKNYPWGDSADELFEAILKLK